VIARLSGLAVTAAALAAPASAHGCSVCSSATEQNRMAFLVTTIVLSLLPLAMLGFGIWWLRRQALLAAAEEAAMLPETTR
jgi:hypothetical protein